MAGHPERRGCETPDTVRRDAAIHCHRERPRGVHPQWSCTWLGGGADVGNSRRRNGGRTLLRDVPSGTGGVLLNEPLSPIENPRLCGWLLWVALYSGNTRYGDQ